MKPQRSTGSSQSRADTRGFVGTENLSFGNVVVEDAGSAWNHLGANGTLEVGGRGTGFLTIRTGGVVTTAQTGGVSATIGRFASAVGSVTISGAGSVWTNAGNIVVGDLGTATLTITNGATVTAGNGTGTVTIGANNNSKGTLNIGATFGIPISGPGAVNQIANGTTTLTANNTFTGPLTVSGGLLELSIGGRINNASDSNVAVR